MKYNLTVLLLCSFFLSFISSKPLESKIIRKLEGTDTDIDYGDSYDGNTTGTVQNKSSSLQIISFANYAKEKEQIKFDVFFYFLGRKIAKFILFQLGAIYSSNLRNLQDNSIQTNCTIKNQNLIDKVGNGEIIDYDCKATVDENANLEKVYLDKENPLTVVSNNGAEESIDFTEVSFNGDANEESYNIQESKNLSKTGSLDNSEVETPVQINYFRIYGAPNPNDLLTKGEAFNMTFLNNSDGVGISTIYKCNVIQVASKWGIECDTKNNKINTTIKDLHLSTGSNSNKLLVIQMKNWENNNTVIITPTSSNTVKENSTADEPAKVINANTPVSTETKKIDNKNSSFQINRFANYNRSNINKLIKFDTFFYYLSSQIVKDIIFRLRVTYLKSLRNLQQETNAESIPANCTLDNANLADQTGTEIVVKYICQAETLTDSNLQSVEINTDIPIIVKDKNGNSKTIYFNDVNFNGNSTNESKNLALLNNIPIKNSGTLNNGEIEFPVQKNYFRIIGTLSKSNLLSQKETITLSIIDRSTGVKTPTQYDCTATQITPKCILQCNTENQPLKSTKHDIHLSSGVSDSNNNLLVIQMKDWGNDKDIIETPSSAVSTSNKVRRKSGGLSKGAIAGIVIACVAVVAAVIVLAFMIRKRNPPMHNYNNSSNNVVQADSSLKIEN